MSYAQRVDALSRDELPLPIAFLLSCLLSLLLALVAVLSLRPAIKPSPRPVPLHVVMLALPSPPSPPPVAPPPDALPPPQPPIVLPSTPSGTVVLTPARSRTPTPPVKPPLRVVRHSAAHRHVAEPVTRDVPPVEATRILTTAPKAAPAPRPAASDPAARESLQARIREAIHAAFRYPEAARVMGTHGTAVVGFLYRDREAFSIRITRSSFSPILDRAAIDFVRDAELPPPGGLAGQTLNLEVPVVFDLSADED